MPSLNASIKNEQRVVYECSTFSIFFALLVEFTSTPHGSAASVYEVIVRICVNIAQIARYLTSVVFFASNFYAISLHWMSRDST